MTASVSPFSGIIYNWEEKPLNHHVEVICKNTDQHWVIQDTPNVIRKKIAALALFGIFKLAIIVSIRVVTILKGDFIEYARTQVKHDCVNSLECEQDNADALYKRRFYKAIPLEFIKEISKTALMVLAIVPLIIISIFGIIFPYDGRKLFGDIEGLYAPTRYNPYLFLAPCMADHEYRSRETLHYFNKYPTVNVDYLPKYQKARIIYNYKGFFEAKKIDVHNIDYWKLREMINLEKAKFRN